MIYPSLTVVTPSLNQAQFLGKTLDSVLAQEYPRLDFVVMDGGSTDGSLDILVAYENRIRYFSETDRGQSEAINNGWRRSQGEIIAWLNSDDILYPGALNVVGEFFASHPEVDLVYGAGDFIGCEGHVICSYPTREWNYSTLVRNGENFLLQPAVFMRRSLLERVGYLNEGLSYVMDFDYWLRAGFQCTVVYLPVKLAALRLHHASKSLAQTAGFSNELILIYRNLFTTTDLPSPMRALEREAMSSIYHRASDIHFWAGDVPAARYFAWRSFCFRPWKLRRLWLYLTLGKIGRGLAEYQYSNPYLRGTTR